MSAVDDDLLKLAFLSPLPPAPTGVADYSAAILPALAQNADISLFAENKDAPPIANLSPQPLTAYPGQRFAFDAAFFQMGNSAYHAGIYQLFRHYPSILILHDIMLHHFISDNAGNNENFPAYTHELSYELGQAGTKLASEIQFKQAEQPAFEVPLNQRLLDLSLGVIVHSQYAKKALRQRTLRPIFVAPMPANTLDIVPTNPTASLGLPANALALGCFGGITPARQMGVVCDALSIARKSAPDIYLVIVGAVENQAQLNRQIQSAGVGDWVFQVGRIPELPAFYGWMASVDILINLRFPTAGESSSIAMDAMGLGLPQIVTDVDSYAELPGEVCRKIPPHHPEKLAAEIVELGANGDMRHQMGAAARKYARRHHNPSQTAQAYLNAAQAILEPIYAG